MNQDTDFQKTVLDYYRDYGRHDMPWRQPDDDSTYDPYKILVSELMLQQTQVKRVVPKYHEFIEKFPSVQALASAPLGDVLKVWTGLGYNRRAKYLHQAATAISLEFNGAFPKTKQRLVSLPGVGPNTAGAILAYAYNQPVVFIETNIRTVYIHHYFTDQYDVMDTELLPIITRTLDAQNPRQWYWALMDYGSYLKNEVGNKSRNSKHYAKQSTFEGSNRQIRGAIIKLLAQSPENRDFLAAEINDKRFDEILEQLVQEGLVQKQGSIYTL